MKNFDLQPELLLRTPALPFSCLWERIAAMQDPETTTAVLQEVFREPMVQEALFLGSPNLHQRCQEWLQGEIQDKKEARRLAQSLLRYYLRMSTRCTPFGLFAACSMGRWDSATDMELLPLEATLRNTRLDMHYLCALAQHLEQDHRLRAYLNYYPNTSLYSFGDKLRFVEYYYKDSNRHHQISAVSSSPYLLTLLEVAKGGASLNALAETLLDGEVSLEEAQAFVHEVIDSQLLVSELEPAITGEDLLVQLLGILHRIQDQQTVPFEDLRQITGVLGRVRELLNSLDKQQAEDKYPVYRQIVAELDQLGVAYDISKLFQVDMGRKTKKLQLRSQLAGSIRRGLEVLNQLRNYERDAQQQAGTNLQQFRDAFYQRYETKEVPLLQVLDNESGIGYLQSTGPGDTNPMIDDIQIHKEESPSHPQLGKRAAFLLERYLEAANKDAYELELQDEDLKDFPSVWEDMPDTLSVMGALVGTEKETEKIYIKSAGGSSAVNLLGRFTQLDPEIDRFSRKLTRHEQEMHPEVIFAEIVHLPEARIGNILMRTQLRPYEIPFLAKSSVTGEQQIALQDLLLSVQGDRLVLRSKKLNKQIIPRLSTAHNYSLSALPVYQLLCDLQFQGLPGSQYPQISSGLSFSWGALDRQFRFFPRVTYRNLILSRTAWSLEKKDYQVLLKTAPEKHLEAVKTWRQSLNMPRHIVIADFDNELYVDLENRACLDLFIGELKKRSQLLLKEFLFDPETALVKDTQGEKYSNEFIMAFARKKKKEPAAQPTDKGAVPVIRRSFPVGSEWLYYKLYLGAQSADELLSDYIQPLSEELMENRWIDHWFFIRYADPDLHLRLRFQLKDTRNIGQVIRQVTSSLQPFFDNRKIWKIQTDTYEQEIERYGATTMELSERIFHHDSVAIVHFLEQAQSYEDPELLRWYFAMINIDTFLNCFQMDLPAKTTLLKQLKTSFAVEFAANNKSGTRQLSEKYRTHREAIEDIVRGEIAAFPEELAALLTRKSAAVGPIGQEIAAINASGQLQVGLNSFLGSHIHMLMNRLFRSQQRKYELVIYDMLCRGYQSVLARQQG